MEGKVAVLGDADFVVPFSALGLDTFTVGSEAGQTIESAKKIVEGKYALVIVAEDQATSAQEVFAGLQNLPTPCVVVVPFTTEPTGLATKTLSEALKMATGIDIFQNH